MTTKSFYKGQGNKQDSGTTGVYFDVAEDQLARELKARKQEQNSKQRKVDKVIAESNQIKELKQKIQQGYLNKERAKQMVDKQVRKVDQLVNEAAFQADMIKQKQALERKLWEDEEQKAQKRYLAKQVLERQMQEKKDKEKQAYDQYLREKEDVDKVMQKIINDEVQLRAFRQTQKKKDFEDMKIQLDLKSQKKQEEQQLKKTQNQQYMSYLKQLDGRDEAIKKGRQEKQEAKNKLLDKLSAQQQKRRREVEELQYLRRQLYQEEYEANLRKQERLEFEKRQSHKIQMQQAEQEAKQRKRRQQDEEKMMELQFRDMMLQKFSQQDKLEQMVQQKRRMKEQEHKRQVERMWQQKLKAYKEQKLIEEEEERKRLGDIAWEEELIRREKEKLLKQHLPNLQGFLPKQLAKVSSGFSQNSGSQFKQTGYSNAYKV